MLSLLCIDYCMFDVTKSQWMQVLTIRQSAMLLVYAYPYLSDISAAMNALAELQGQPSVAEVAAQATAAVHVSACLQIPGKLQNPHVCSALAICLDTSLGSHQHVHCTLLLAGPVPDKHVMQICRWLHAV